MLYKMKGAQSEKRLKGVQLDRQMEGEMEHESTVCVVLEKFLSEKDKVPVVE